MGRALSVGVPSAKPGFLIQFYDLIACDLGKVTNLSGFYHKHWYSLLHRVVVMFELLRRK